MNYTLCTYFKFYKSTPSPSRAMDPVWLSLPLSAQLENTFWSVEVLSKWSLSTVMVNRGPVLQPASRTLSNANYE